MANLWDGEGWRSTYPYENHVGQSSPIPPPVNAFRAVGKEAVCAQDPSRADADTGALTLLLRHSSVRCNHKPTYVDTYGITSQLACGTQKGDQMVSSYFYLIT